MAITMVNVIHDVPVSSLAGDAVELACSAYPVTSRRNDGLLACAYRSGSRQHSADGIGIVRTSADQGKTWSAPAVYFDCRDQDPPQSLITSQMVAPRDGTLLALCSVTVCTHPDHDFMDTEEGYAQESRCYKARSVDGGSTWSPPQLIEQFKQNQLGLSGRSFVLPDGQLLINRPLLRPDGMHVAAGCFSSDHGETLSSPVTFSYDPTGRLSYDEAYYTVFDDDMLLVLYWTWIRDMSNPRVMRIAETLPVHRSVSHDLGRTWSSPQPTQITGQLTCPLAVDSRTMIAANNYRQTPAGIRLWFSHDRGESFDTDHVVQMWDTQQQRMVAEPLSPADVASDAAQDHEMQSFTFGLPDLNDLGDGTYLLTYYATIDKILHVRACRFELT